MTALLRRTATAWQRFWFEPRSTSTLALFRVAFGLVGIGWTLSLTPNLFAFLGPDGIAPDSFGRAAGEWGLLTGTTGPTAVVAVFLGTLAGAVALTVGWHARIAALVVSVGIVSVEQRNPLISNSGGGLLRNLAFYCVLAPSGAALSLDRLRAGRDAFWRFPQQAPWALRLIQIQVSVGYLAVAYLAFLSPVTAERLILAPRDRIRRRRRRAGPGGGRAWRPRRSPQRSAAASSAAVPG